eukprot:sb/3464412/
MTTICVVLILAAASGVLAGPFGNRPTHFQASEQNQPIAQFSSVDLLVLISEGETVCKDRTSEFYVRSGEMFRMECGTCLCTKDVNGSFSHPHTLSLSLSLSLFLSLSLSLSLFSDNHSLFQLFGVVKIEAERFMRSDEIGEETMMLLLSVLLGLASARPEIAVQFFGNQEEIPSFEQVDFPRSRYGMCYDVEGELFVSAGQQFYMRCGRCTCDRYGFWCVSKCPPFTNPIIDGCLEVRETADECCPTLECIKWDDGATTPPFQTAATTGPAEETTSPSDQGGSTESRSTQGRFDDDSSSTENRSTDEVSTTESQSGSTLSRSGEGTDGRSTEYKVYTTKNVPTSEQYTTDREDSTPTTDSGSTDGGPISDGGSSDPDYTTYKMPTGPTTEQSTEQSTDQSSEQSTGESSTTEQTTGESSTTEQSTGESSTTEQTTGESSTTDRQSTGEGTNAPTTDGSTTNAPTTASE